MVNLGVGVGLRLVSFTLIPPAVASVEDDVDLDDEPETGYDEDFISGGATDGTNLLTESTMVVMRHRYAGGLGIVEAVPILLGRDSSEWRSFS